MRITPKTDQQIIQENLWPEGEYDFEVAAAEETTSKKGNPMIKVTLNVFWENKSRSITDYLMEKMAFKLKHFLFTVGMGANYESGEFGADQFIGRSGRLTLKQEQQEGYNPKNVVDDYVVAKEGEKPKPTIAKLMPGGAPADDVPFMRHEDRSW